MLKKSCLILSLFLASCTTIDYVYVVDVSAGLCSKYHLKEDPKAPTGFDYDLVSNDPLSECQGMIAVTPDDLKKIQRFYQNNCK